MNKEIEIPEGYEARIDGNKVIFEPKENEGERIRKAISYAICSATHKDGTLINDVTKDEALSYLENRKEQKPTEWDEVDYDEEIADLCDGSMSLTSKDIALHFYELGQRHYKPVEWSEEDRKHLDWIIEHFSQGGGLYDNLIYWLTQLPKRFNLQSNQEWSEEDDALLKEIVAFFKDGTVKLQHDLDLYAEFLQNKFKSPHHHWKPSKKQMNALARATNRCVGVDDAKILIKLLEQLESL